MTEPVIEGQALIAQMLMKHRSELFAYLIAATRNPHDAEDLLQDVSLAASTSWGQYRPGTPFLAWAREIARRRILDYGKKQSRRFALMEPDVLEASTPPRWPSKPNSPSSRVAMRCVSV